jgi:hypothetical protein
MANVQIKNSITNTNAAKRTRYEKMETAYGKIPAAAWADGDTLQFTEIPMLNLIHARFVASVGSTPELELFSGADLSSPIDWNLANSGNTTGDISYVISYIRGTGNVRDGVAWAGEGKLIQLHMYVND